jgi:SAM-dependent methyltransferase
VQTSSKVALVGYLRTLSFHTLLDAPSGNGWLAQELAGSVEIDGVDLYMERRQPYRRFWRWDLNQGLPPECGGFDVACCCEGLSYLGNPLLLLQHLFGCLKPGGRVIVSTPNTGYPDARLRQLVRGLDYSFPRLPEGLVPGQPLHISPWTYPYLYIYLTLAGFRRPLLIPEPLNRAKHAYEWVVGLPALWHARWRLKRARSPEEREFWQVASSVGSVFGRHLLVAAEKPRGDAQPTAT